MLARNQQIARARVAQIERVNVGQTEAPAPAPLAVDQVYHMDALTLLKRLKTGSVNAIITDPPYGLAGRGFEVDRAMRRTDNGKVRGGTYKAINEEWDKDAPLDWFDEAARVLAPGGAVLIFAGRKSVYQFAAEGLKRDWLLVNDVTWHKTNPTPCFTGRQMTMATERLLWFCPDGERWTYNGDAAKAMNRGVNLQDVWVFGIESGKRRYHPAQKPLPLLERCIELFTNPGDLVVDIFNGSGTTCVAAARHGRHYIGCDIGVKNVEIANKRLREPFTASFIEEVEGEPSLAPAPMQLGGRPVITQAEAAARAGVSISTVSRYCTTGHWQARQTDGKHWVVYADQPLTKKTGRRKRG